MSRANWGVPLALFALSALWTWPALFTHGMLGHNPDAAGTVWFVSAAPRLLFDLTDPLTGWPAGATYGRPDSFVLMVLGALLSPIGAARAHALLGLFGVFASAMGAEAFARALGAARPWSALAGVAFAMSGLASTALLEGYVYHVINPWLPLLGLYWWRATRPEGRARDGALAGLFFLLCLLSTAWLGLAAAVLVGGLFLAGLARGGLPARAAGAALGVVALPLGLYVAAFSAGGGDGASDLSHAGNPHHFFSFGLVRLASAPFSVDITGNSQSAVLPGVCLALLLVAPVVLRRESGWRGLALTGAGALGLTLLPGLPLSISADGGVGSVLLASLWRFPERLGWTFLLVAGVVGARVATVLSARMPRLASFLLVGALVDAFVLTRMPFRQRETLATAPSAYGAHSGPVLDLWPEDIEPAPAWTLRTTNLGCAYQATHGRPIADHCVATPGIESPRVRLERWVLGRLLTGDIEAVRIGLGELGFSTLMVHTDLFADGDQARLTAALAALDPAPAESTDGGERVRAYAIPLRPKADPARAWAQWSR